MLTLDDESHTICEHLSSAMIKNIMRRYESLWFLVYDLIAKPYALELSLMF